MKKHLCYSMVVLMTGLIAVSCSNDDEPSGGNEQTASQVRLSSIYYAEEHTYIFSNPSYDSKGRLTEYTGDIDEEFAYLYYSDDETKVKYTYGASEIVVSYKDEYSTNKNTYTLNGDLISQGTWFDKGVTPETMKYGYDGKKCLTSAEEVTNDHQSSKYVLKWDSDGPYSIDTYFSDYSNKHLESSESISYGSRKDNTVMPLLVLVWLANESIGTYINGLDPFLYRAGYFGKCPAALPSGSYSYDEDHEIIKKSSVNYTFNDKGLVSKIIAKVEFPEDSRTKTVTLNVEWE